MAKNKISEWSSTASNNTDVGGIDIAEGCAPGGINNALREIMAQVKDMQTGADSDSLTINGTFTAATIVGDIFASNGSSKILDNGTDGTNAAFTGTVGATTPYSGAFTTLSATGDVTLASTKYIKGDFTNATLLSRTLVQSSTTNGATEITVVPNGTSTSSGIEVYAAATPTNTNFGSLTQSTTITTLSADKAGSGTYGDLTFKTTGTEQGRLNANGGWGFGATNPSTSALWRIYSLGTGTNPAGVFDTQSSSASTAMSTINKVAGGAIRFFYGATATPTEVGSITVTSTATAYNTSSDYRLKSNVVPMTGALNKVLALKPVSYTWKVNDSVGQGFLAHELQEVAPECVTGEKDAVDENGNPIYQAIDTSFLIGTLVSAIQELKAELEALKQTV
jgi:hypothetical protein